MQDRATSNGIDHNVDRMPKVGMKFFFFLKRRLISFIKINWFNPLVLASDEAAMFLIAEANLIDFTLYSLMFLLAILLELEKYYMTVVVYKTELK